MDQFYSIRCVYEVFFYRESDGVFSFSCRLTVIKEAISQTTLVHLWRLMFYTSANDFSPINRPWKEILNTLSHSGELVRVSSDYLKFKILPILKQTEFMKECRATYLVIVIIWILPYCHWCCNIKNGKNMGNESQG